MPSAVPFAVFTANDVRRAVGKTGSCKYIRLLVNLTQEGRVVNVILVPEMF